MDWKERFKQEGSRALSQQNISFDDNKPRVGWQTLSQGLFNPQNHQIQSAINNGADMIERLKKQISFQIPVSENKMVQALSQKLREKIIKQYEESIRDKHENQRLNALQNSSNQNEQTSMVTRLLGISLQLKLRRMLEEEQNKYKTPKKYSQLKTQIDSLILEEQHSKKYFERFKSQSLIKTDRFNQSQSTIIPNCNNKLGGVLQKIGNHQNINDSIINLNKSNDKFPTQLKSLVEQQNIQKVQIQNKNQKGENVETLRNLIQQKKIKSMFNTTNIKEQSQLSTLSNFNNQSDYQSAFKNQDALQSGSNAINEKSEFPIQLKQNLNQQQSQLFRFKKFAQNEETKPLIKLNQELQQMRRSTVKLPIKVENKYDSNISVLKGQFLPEISSNKHLKSIKEKQRAESKTERHHFQHTVHQGESFSGTYMLLGNMSKSRDTPNQLLFVSENKKKNMKKNQLLISESQNTSILSIKRNSSIERSIDGLSEQEQVKRRKNYGIAQVETSNRINTSEKKKKHKRILIINKFPSTRKMYESSYDITHFDPRSEQISLARNSIDQNMDQVSIVNSKVNQTSTSNSSSKNNSIVRTFRKQQNETMSKRNGIIEQLKDKAQSNQNHMLVIDVYNSHFNNMPIKSQPHRKISKKGGSLRKQSIKESQKQLNYILNQVHEQNESLYKIDVGSQDLQQSQAGRLQSQQISPSNLINVTEQLITNQLRLQQLRKLRKNQNKQL
eukprot:403358574